jgi:hypothetical protein
MFASVLIALTLSPVTAPFSTCEVATFFHHVSQRAALPSRAPGSEQKSTASAQVTLLPVVSTTGARSRLVIFTSRRVTSSATMADAGSEHRSLSRTGVGPDARPATNLRV